MSTGGLQTRSAAQGVSTRPPKMAPQKPSRLPLHRRPSTDRTSPPASLLVSQTENLQAFDDANKRNERLISGSRATHKSTQVRANRLSLPGRQSAADEVVPRRRSEPQARPHPSNVTGVVRFSSAQNHLVSGGLIDDKSCAIRLADSPTCGARMSALRSAGKDQQPSPTSFVKSSSTATDRHAAAVRRRDDVVVGVQRRRVAEPRDKAFSHRASTSSVNSTCSEHLQRNAQPLVPRRTVSLSTDDKQNNSSSRDSSASQSCRKSEIGRQNISSKSDEIMSSRSDCLKPPVSRRLPAAYPQTEKLQRRSASVSNILRTAEHQQRLHNAIVEPRRHYYHLWRLSESDVDDFSVAGSMSTITSIDSSLSSSSPGTLTDDDDESTDESTTVASRDRRLQDRGDVDTSNVCSDRLDCSTHVTPTSYRASMASSHQTSTCLQLSRCTRRSLSSSELPSSLSATSSSQLPAENYLEDIQQTGSVRMTSHAPLTRRKYITTSPSAPPQGLHGAINRSKNRPLFASESEANLPPSPRRLPPEVKTTAAGHVIHSPSLAAVGRCHQTVINDSSLAQANSNVVLTSVAAKPPTLQPHSRVQTRLQADTGEKATAVAAGISNPKSSFNHFTVSSPSKVPCQTPSRRASGIPNMRAASKTPSVLGVKRQTGTSTDLVMNATDKGRPNLANGHELVNKSIGDPTAGVMASRSAVKQPTAAIVKRVKSSQSRTAYGIDNSRLTKSVRDVSTPTQTSSTAATRLAKCNTEKSAVTKRPPPPLPSKIKKPFVPVLTAASDRRRVNVAEQKRPTSMDCLAVSSIRQQSADVCCAKSNSSVNMANPSTSIGQAPATKKSARGVLNKNIQLAKSYDCISPLSSNQERQNCLQMHGSWVSLVDMPPRKLMKPYSVINRCSTFGRTPSNVIYSSSEDSNKNIKTENVATSNRSSLASQARASELFDVPEIDEVECDFQMSTISRISMDEADKSNNVRRLQSPVETTATIKSPSICPSMQQKSTERYRSEYSTFLSALPQKDSKLVSETVQVASSNISLSHQDCISVTAKQDKNDTEENCSFKTRLQGNCKRHTDNVDDMQIECYAEPDKKSCVPAARPVTLPAEIAILKDASADAAVDNYVVTYESDNIVVLDRAPVIDCLTPEGDVVSTEACQRLLNMHTDSVCTAPAEGALTRTLPLSESGYDTWKSSQGSVVVANNCVDMSAEQHQKLEKDGTLRSCDCDRLKHFDTQSAQRISEKNVDTEGRETYCPEEGSDTLESFKAGGNLPCESTNSAAGVSAAVEVRADDRCGESVSCDDESGRVADCSVEDFALRDAQMFVSICSDVAEPVAGRASSRTAASDGSGPSRSPPDNAMLGLADPIDLCFSLQTIPSNNSDELSAPRNAAHLDRFNEDARDDSLLLSGMDHFQHPVDVELSGTSDISVDVGQDDRCLDSAVITTRKTAAVFDAGKDCAADVEEGHTRVSELSSTEETTDSTRPLPSSTDATVSDSVVLDSYETICEDLLESIEDNASDSERSYPSSSTCQPSAPCSTAVDEYPKQSEVLKSANDHEIVAVSSSDVDWKPTHSDIPTLNSKGPPSTATSGHLPVMTLRRVRTNFSVVYCQTASQPKASQSQQQPAHVNKAGSHEATSDRVDDEPQTVGCRRALAVLASKLDEHSRRDGRAASKPSFQSADVHRDSDVVAVSPAVSMSLSSQFRPGVSCTAVSHNSTVVDHDSAMLSSKPTKSSMNAADVTSARAESKLPVSTASARSSVAKKPLTFRKLLSSKLTSVVRRTKTKSDIN